MEFSPLLSPQEILLAGAFGGSYFGIEVEITREFPYQELFDETLSGVPEELYLSPSYKKSVNRFKTDAGLPYADWKAKGWIHEDDPYGWFEWYLKYHAGRRHPDDARQIRRWSAFCGETGRWRLALYKKILETRNWWTSPRIQQSLLHWGYIVNHSDWIQFLERHHPESISIAGGIAGQNQPNPPPSK